MQGSNQSLVHSEPTSKVRSFITQVDDAALGTQLSGFGVGKLYVDLREQADEYVVNKSCNTR